MRRLQNARVLAVAILVIGLLAAPAAASAGTLTAATFTTAGTGYAVTSAQNTRYDWNFTTASAATLTRVGASVPAGTNSYGTRTVAFPGRYLNYASTPDSAANSPTGDIDIKTKFSVPQNINYYGQFLDKWVSASNQDSFQFMFTSGGSLEVNWSKFGNDNTYQQSSVPIAPAPNVPMWARVTVQLTNGTNSVFNFYTSTDGTNWTQLGATRTSAPISIFDSNSPLEVGSSDLGTQNTAPESIYFLSLANGITGTTTSPSTCNSTGVSACFNPNDASQVQGAAGAWSSSSPSNEPWTLNRSGSYLPTDIAAALTV